MQELMTGKDEGRKVGGIYSTRENHPSLSSLPSTRYRIHKSSTVSRATTPRKQENLSHEPRRDQGGMSIQTNPQMEYTIRKVPSKVFDPTSSSKTKAQPNLSALRREFAMMKKDHKVSMKSRLKHIEVLQDVKTRPFGQTSCHFSTDRHIHTDASTPLQASLINVSPLFSDAPRDQLTKSVNQLSQPSGIVSRLNERNLKLPGDVRDRRRVVATKISFLKTTNNLWNGPEGSYGPTSPTPIQEKEESDQISITEKQGSLSPTLPPTKKITVLARTNRTNRLSSLDDRLTQIYDAATPQDPRSPLLNSPTRSVSLAGLEKAKPRLVGDVGEHFYLQMPGECESPEEKNSLFESPKALKQNTPYISRFGSVSKRASTETRLPHQTTATQPVTVIKKAQLVVLRSEGVSPIKKSKLRSAIFPALAKQPQASSTKVQQTG